MNREEIRDRLVAAHQLACAPGGMMELVASIRGMCDDICGAPASSGPSAEALVKLLRGRQAMWERLRDSNADGAFYLWHQRAMEARDAADDIELTVAYPEQMLARGVR